MQTFNELVADATGTDDDGELAMIIECMRADVFHGAPLGSRTEEEIRTGGKLAVEVLIALGDL